MAGLALTYRGMVYPWHCDHIGHMNVMWYASMFDQATWHLLHLIGLSPAYFRQHHRGMAAVQQDVTYKRELRAGDLVAIRSGVLEIKAKMIHFHHKMRNDETGDVAATAVMTGVHLDVRTRKSCPFPATVVTRGRALIVPNAPGA